MRNMGCISCVKCTFIICRSCIIQMIKISGIIDKINCPQCKNEIIITREGD
jgi:hypothetical protein